MSTPASHGSENESRHTSDDETESEVSDSSLDGDDTSDYGQSEDADTINHRRSLDPRVYAARGPNLSKSQLRSQNRKSITKGWYRSRYRAFLNAEIESVAGRTAPEAIDLDPSVIGVSIWSAYEKQLLFTHLPVVGCGNARRLAQLIGSKSETEVRQYLDLLLLASKEDYARSHLFGSTLDDTPAAVEVPPDLDQQLNLAADCINFKTMRLDESREIARHGDRYWLLTTQVADEVESLELSKPPNHQAETKEDLPVPAASLLHLKNWLELAKLFMISVDGKMDWTDYIEDNSERPSMYYTTFSDFHHLAISFTKRLVLTTIFQTLSRLRATDSNDPEQAVRHQDVQAACRLIGFQTDWRGFWVRAPRRLHLDVYTTAVTDGEPDSSRARILDYDTVERALRSDFRIDLTEGELSEPTLDQAADIAVVPTIEGDSSDSETSFNSDLWTDTSSSADQEEQQDSNMDERDGDKSSPSPSSSTASAPVSHDSFKMETQYLEALDHQASQIEAQKLSGLLTRLRKGNEKIKIEESDPIETKLPPQPPRKRKRAADIEDWRDNVQYRPEWQSHLPLDDEAFLAMSRRGAERKKRRLQKQAQSQQ